MAIDLHTHSTASDGALTPGELVRAAARAGVTTLALTDHDTVAGVPEARQEAERAGIELIAGVELNTDVPRGEVHILGFYVDPDLVWFAELLAEQRRRREERGRRIVARLQELGLPLDFGQVLRLTRGGVVTRPHVAQAMVEAGLVSSRDEAFRRYLYTGGPAYVAREGLSPQEAVTALHQAGALAVLAHPGRLPGAAWVGRLLAMGVDGLEVYYPDHSPQEVAAFLALARERDLLVTGGSDFHGPDLAGARGLGSQPVPPEVLAPLRARGNRRPPGGSCGD